MTHPDEVLRAAREDAIKWIWHLWPDAAAMVRSGEFDQNQSVQMFAEIRMAERERCAGIAAERQQYGEKERLLFQPDTGSRWEMVGYAGASRDIKAAILGQQEGA